MKPVAWQFERYNYETWDAETLWRNPLEIYTSIEDTARIRNIVPLYTADQLREAQMKVLREAAETIWAECMEGGLNSDTVFAYEGIVSTIKNMADELEAGK